MSQITTHILDTTKGKPAQGVTITLHRGGDQIAKGITNSDGRIPDLLKKDVILESGEYRMRFEVKGYFDKNSITAFYPFIDIVFVVSGSEHYHIPLLLNPFGYSTYRGS